MSSNDFEAAIKHLQATAGESSEQFEILRKALLAMANDQSSERDTRFIGFAKLLWDELLASDSDAWFDVADPTPYQQIIARRAYDLLDHASQYVLVRPEDVPDLTTWPTDPGTSSQPDQQP